MKKNEVAAFLILESMTDPVKPKNLQVMDKNNLFFVRFETVLQEWDVFNRNRRKYTSSAMAESLQAPHLVELLKKKALLGEAGHPMTEDVKRILTIDPKLTCYRINSWNTNGNFLRGNVETLDDGLYGTQFTKNILQGMEPAFSLRALAQLSKQGDGSQIVQSRAHIVTYDAVILPSHPTAYRDQTKPIEKIIKNIEAGGNTVQESTVAVMESQLLDYIKVESDNFKVVSSVCEASGSMSITKDLQHVVIKENNKTFLVNIEDKIKNDYRDYLKKL